MVFSERTRSNEHKLKYRKFHLKIEKTFCTVRVVKYRNRFPGEVIQNLAKHRPNDSL